MVTTAPGPKPTPPSLVVKPGPSGGGTVTTPSTPAAPVVADPYGNLDGANRDAAAYLINLFKQYGLDSLAPQIITMIQNGFSADTISIELQNTKEYQTRFAANATRIKNGLPPLSPAEYVATERSYRSIMAAAGLPEGFYDSTSDFQSFLERDISPTELKDRVDIATEAVTKAPKETLDYFKQWYDTGDMIAFALDPTKAQPLIDKKIRAAEAAAVAKTQGVSLGQQTAETIGNSGANFNQIQQGLGFVGQELPGVSKTAQIYGDTVTADDLVNEVFNNDATVTTKRNKLASQERATFGSRGGVGQATLSKDAGQF